MAKTGDLLDPSCGLSHYDVQIESDNKFQVLYNQHRHDLLSTFVVTMIINPPFRALAVYF